MNASRATVLDRIRRALIRPGREHQGNQAQSDNLTELFASEALDPSLMVKRFQEELERVGGETRTCEDIREALRHIQDLIITGGYRNVAISKHEICQRHQLEQELSAAMPEVSFWSENLDPESRLARQRNSAGLAQADLSITGAEYLIAESGTVVLSTHASASRQISLLPTAHLVLATSEQVCPNLSAVFQDLEIAAEKSRLPTALTLITGPSRTADIEKVLIKGAHGPVRQLTWVILGSDSAAPWPG